MNDEMATSKAQKPALLGPRFRQALEWAASLHEAQTRKGGSIPYVSHLLAVTAIVLEHGGDEDAAIAALLHDAVEDQGGAPLLAEIRTRYGDKVAEIVEACSDTAVVPKPPWRERKQAFLDRLPTASRDTLLVALADKLHNVRSKISDFREVGDALWDRFNRGREEQFWYYHELIRLFRTRDEFPELAAELERAVGELERLSAG